ncbi:MAG: hypothetical protein NUV53_00550 [Patescibacteria group bacterium]|nr:hypothetical protein [Patescibacteria group bacterium]
MQVIPSINCPDVECARENLRVLQGVAEWVHLDVADARFTFNKTWGDPLSWPIFGKVFNLEVHLMVEEPDQVIEGWIHAGAKTIIVHIEALEDERFYGHGNDPILTLKKMQALCASQGVVLTLGIRSETFPERLRPYMGIVERFLVLSVHPGLAGQSFLPVSLETIKWIRKEVPHATIEVDGGVNLETAVQVKAIGTDVAVAASFIFSSGMSPKESIEKLARI